MSSNSSGPTSDDASSDQPAAEETVNSPPPQLPEGLDDQLPAELAPIGSPALGHPGNAVKPTLAPAPPWVVGGAMIAAVVSIVGTFLPWFTATVGSYEATRNGYQLGKNNAFSVDGIAVDVVCCAVIALCLARLFERPVSPAMARAPFIGGAVLAIVFLYPDYHSIQREISRVAAAGFSASMGYGYWVCVAGALVATLLGGAAWVIGSKTVVNKT